MAGDLPLLVQVVASTSQRERTGRPERLSARGCASRPRLAMTDASGKARVGSGGVDCVERSSPAPRTRWPDGSSQSRVEAPSDRACCVSPERVRSRRPAVAAPVPGTRPAAVRSGRIVSSSTDGFLSGLSRRDVMVRDNELSEASESATQHRRSNTGEDASVARHGPFAALPDRSPARANHRPDRLDPPGLQPNPRVHAPTHALVLLLLAVGCATSAPAPRPPSSEDHLPPARRAESGKRTTRAIARRCASSMMRSPRRRPAVPPGHWSSTGKGSRSGGRAISTASTRRRPRPTSRPTCSPPALTSRPR